MLQNGQTEPKRKLWDTRSCTASKQSPPRFILALAKIYAWFLALPSPQKVRWTFWGPRKSQDFKGKRSNGAALACLQLQTAISDCCDAGERRSLFVAKRLLNIEKLNTMKFFDVFCKCLLKFFIYFYCFSCLFAVWTFFTPPFNADMCN